MKKVLLVTYYWPPAGGPGVQRWLQFVKHFSANGIAPVVFIPENPHYPLLDESFINEVPKDITIVRFPIKEPYKIAQLFSKKETKALSSGLISKKKNTLIQKVLLYIRGNYFIPDARIGWVEPSVDFLERYLIDQAIDTVITSGPPHSLHLIGMQLKQKLSIQWLADFRDPWTTIHYHKDLSLTEASQKKHKQLEAQVLTEADHITVTSPSTKKEFRAITNKPITTITNGYDASKEIITTLDTSFSIAHIGSLLVARNPEVLWQVLKEISLEIDGFSNDLQLVFAGTTALQVFDSLKEYDLEKNIINKGYISHTQAMQLQRSSRVLLVLEIDSEETKAIIPGKLFEYLQARRPIIALGPKESDIESILIETGAGVFISQKDKKAIKTEILKRYNHYKFNKDIALQSDISGYAREALTKKMATVIKGL